MAAVKGAAVSAVHLLQLSSISWGCTTHPTADVTCTTPQRTRADLMCTTILSGVQGENKHFSKGKHQDVKLQVPWTHTGRSLNCSDLGPCRHQGHDTGHGGLSSPSAPHPLHNSTSSAGNCNHHPLPSRHSTSDSMSWLLQGRSGTRKALQNIHSHPNTPLKESKVMAFHNHCCYKCFKEKRKP